jgi:hypothetical protein
MTNTPAYLSITSSMKKKCYILMVRHSKNMLLPLLANARLGWKVFRQINTPAYFSEVSDIKCAPFQVLHSEYRRLPLPAIIKRGQKVQHSSLFVHGIVPGEEKMLIKYMDRPLFLQLNIRLAWKTLPGNPY